jgi:hypothetical protein
MFDLFLTVDKPIEDMETRLFVVEDLVDHKNPGGIVYQARFALGSVGIQYLMDEIRRESEKQRFVIMNVQTTTVTSEPGQFKVLFLTDKSVDPTLYNFKELSTGDEFCTYVTNDFHNEKHCYVIMSDFEAQCTGAGVLVMGTQLINKEHINKKHL